LLKRAVGKWTIELQRKRRKCSNSVFFSHIGLLIVYNNELSNPILSSSIYSMISMVALPCLALRFSVKFCNGQSVMHDRRASQHHALPPPLLSSLPWKIEWIICRTKVLSTWHCDFV